MNTFTSAKKHRRCYRNNRLWQNGKQEGISPGKIPDACRYSVFLVEMAGLKARGKGKPAGALHPPGFPH